MENELREKILVLKTLLERRNNKSFAFFEKLLTDLDHGQINEVVKSILKSYSIVQYAELYNNEETLLGDIWDLAEKITRSDKMDT